MNTPLLFGEWLRSRRDGLGLTRKEFAGRVGCSVSTLRKIEDGERRPSGQIAELIANSLDIPAAEHGIFIRVARGDLGTDHLLPTPEWVTHPNISSTKTNLPILPTPLVGRQNEIGELIRILSDPACRLLTLVGPGGIGKTRLAIETAMRAQESFVDGTYFIPLASVNSTRFIVPAIADAVGFAFQGTNLAEPKTQLFNYLKAKQILLLADNMEHLLNESGVEVLAELIAISPNVKLMVTSRESLGLQGEWIFEVQGLPVPENLHTEESSIELFLQRARRAHVGFNATPEDFPAILRLCRLVDGMPLAIELAAAWVRTLTCNEIAKEIEHSLDFLSVNTRDLPARHRSMRAVFDHSWKLLSEEEQHILARLSVFRGGFQREAAEQVAGASISMLSALMTKSLIRRSGANRYDLHELVRQYAADRLADQPTVKEEAQDDHACYVMEYFSNQDVSLRSSRQQETLAEMTAEMDNFRAAWEWAVAHGEFAVIEQTMRAFTMLYDTRGWLQEGLDTLDRAITALETVHEHSPFSRTDQVALGHIMTSRSLLAARLGQHEQAQTMLERSLEILRPLNASRVLVEAITFLGMVMDLTGNYARALELYSEGLDLAKEIGDQWFAALCFTAHTGLAGITHIMIKPEIAHERMQNAIADWRVIGDPRLTAIGLNNLSLSALRLGRYDEARAVLEESVALSISVGDRYGLGFAYRGLGIVAQMRGDHPQAIDMFHKSLDTLTELGARQDMARILAEMSRSIFALGNDVEARHAWEESLRLAIETRGTFIALEALVGIASLQAKRGNLEYALELVLIVLNHPSSFQASKERASNLRNELETHLTSQQVEVAQARARAKTFELAVDETLKGR